MANPVTTKEKFVIKPSFLGIQRRSNTYLRKDSDVYDGLNAQFYNPLGAISKAPGYTAKGTTVGSGGTILGLGAINTSGGTNKLIAIEGNAAHILSGSTWSDETGGGASLTTSAKAEFESFLDYLFMVNYSDATRSYDGSSWSTTANVTDAPKARYIKNVGVRLFLANINLDQGGDKPSWGWFTDLPSNGAITWGFESGTDLVQTSSTAVVTSAAALFKTRNIKVGDPFIITTGTNAGEYVVASVDSETQITLTKTLANSQSSKAFWCGGNYIEFKTNDSDVLTGIGKLGNQVLFFKRDTLIVLTGANAIDKQSALPVKNVPGTTSHRSITEIRDWTFYHHGPTGIWRYNGVTSELISDPLWDYIAGVSASNYASVVGWSSDNRILRMYLGTISNTNVAPELSLSDAVFCFDTMTETSWIESKGITITAKTDFVESSAVNTYVGTSSGVDQIDTGNSLNGADMPFLVDSYPYYVIAPEVTVPITRIKMFVKRNMGMNVKYKLWYDDDNLIDSEWKSFADINSKPNFLELILPSKNRAAGISFEIDESGQNLGPLIERIAIFYLPDQAQI